MSDAPGRLYTALARLRVAEPFNRSTSFAVDIVFFDWLAIPLTKLAGRIGRLTPNMVTVLSGAIGLGAGALFWSERYVLGATVMYLSMLLDCVDGNLARMTGTTSELGAKLDAASDSLKKAFCLTALIWVSSWPLPLLAGLVLAHYALLRLLPARGDPQYRRQLALRFSLEPFPEPYDMMVLLLFVGPLVHFEAGLCLVLAFQIVGGFGRSTRRDR